MENNNPNNQTIETPHVDAALQQCQAERDSFKEKYARAIADFDNFQKRTDKERMQWMSSAQTAVLNDILSVYDDIERALEQMHKQEQSQTFASVIAGLEMIKKSVLKTLNKHGVTLMTQITDFDPEMHEALMHVDSQTHTSGQIVAVLQQGFMHKEVVLRPAKVSVAK